MILGFLGLAVVYMQIALLFVPAETDFAHPHLEAVVLPRVVLAIMTVHMVSQWHDIWAFHFWKALTRGRHLWLRNNASTVVSQFMDTAVFCTIAFWGLFPMSVWLQILASTYHQGPGRLPGHPVHLPSGQVQARGRSGRGNRPPGFARRGVDGPRNAPPGCPCPGTLLWI